MSNERIATSVRLTPDMHKWFKEEASRLGMSLNSFLSFALTQYKEQYLAERKER